MLKSLAALRRFARDVATAIGPARSAPEAYSRALLQAGVRHEVGLERRVDRLPLPIRTPEGERVVLVLRRRPRVLLELAENRPVFGPIPRGVELRHTQPNRAQRRHPAPQPAA